ncbi:hypothetical protein [Streptomyces sp. S063]|uniref:hypothetical protein n=1 Tax=Streptomyces sp. S063 TaxID=2005885 RepID=UPI001F1AF03D|nr:hypothetical protein [Streptomyces sp. S063]
MLEVWGENGKHSSEIIGVMVSESPDRDDPGAPMRPWRKRDEMWLATRALLQPDPSTGSGRLRLRVDREAGIQLTTPNLGNNAGGHSVVESKKAMKARGMNSPDRTEAVLLAVYEPNVRRPRPHRLTAVRALYTEAVAWQEQVQHGHRPRDPTAPPHRWCRPGPP